MDVVKMFVTFLLVFTFKTVNCRLSSAHVSKLYFHLLQTDDNSDEETLHPRSGIRRPSPSDYLPVDDLLENDSDIYDPRPSDMNIKSLRQQLGKLLDKEYMSVRDPRNIANKKSLIRLVKGRPKGRRPNYLSLLRTARLQDGRKIKLNVSKKDRKKFQKFVWSLTFCPVKHSWKFLGIRFWPQWLKEGTCYSQRSCSIPPGMMCKPSASTSKTFLRWHCTNFKERHACRWIPIQYPIITECACSCSSNKRSQNASR